MDRLLECPFIPLSHGWRFREIAFPFFFLLLFLPSFSSSSSLLSPGIRNEDSEEKNSSLERYFPLNGGSLKTRRGSCSPKKNNSRERRFYDRGIGFSYECERRERRGKESGETAEANSFNEIRNFIDPLVVSRFPASSTRHGERCARSRERWDQMVKKYTG